MKCPVCGKDPRRPVSEGAKELVRQRLISEYMNPGGRELVLSGYGRVQLEDQCGSCDEATIHKVFGLPPIKPCRCGAAYSAQLQIETPSAMPGSIVSYAFVRCAVCEVQTKKVDDWDNRLWVHQAIASWNAAQ